MIVYAIKNINSGKMYVGVTTGSVRKRWREHRCAANTGHQAPLYRAMRKHGIENFSIHEIYRAVDVREMMVVERGLIAAMGTLARSGRGYNQTSGGDGVNCAEMPRGEEAASSKITDDIVRFIRDPINIAVVNADLVIAVAAKFHVAVSRDCLRDARRGDTWRHLNAECPPVRLGQGCGLSAKKLIACRRTINLPHVRAASAIATTARKGKPINRKSSQNG